MAHESSAGSAGQLPPYRICIFCSAPALHLQHLLWRLLIDLPHVKVAGILYEPRRLPLWRTKKTEWAKRNFRYLGDPDFIRYGWFMGFGRVRQGLEKILALLLHLAHGTDGSPNPAPTTLEELAAECEGHGSAFKITQDIHDEDSLGFVRGLDVDLGVIFGARILKPTLFSIPRRGSINSHQHKLPDYRGSGAPGVWEIRDGKAEQTVAVHRVTTDVDGGAVLDERSFRIEPEDTLTSIELKANLLGVDGLIDVIRAESCGKAVETPQHSMGTLYKGIQPHQMWAIEESINKARKTLRPSAGLPFHKRAAWVLGYPVMFVKNWRRARQKKFPVVILSHQVITDRAKQIALPTDYFLRHIRFLKEHYRIASLPEALGMLKEGRVGAPTVVLTFDYGYADNFLGLRAVIEPERVPVTLFICTRHITEQSEFQHDVDVGEHGFPALGWDEVRYFARHGVYIASQGRTCFDSCSADEKRLEDEIIGSAEDLHRKLGHDVQYFSFSNTHPESISEVGRRIALQSFRFVFSSCHATRRPLPSDPVITRWTHPESLWELEVLLQSRPDSS